MIKKQRGVTLIELMISMVLGLGIIAGIGQLFIQSQKSFRLQRNVSDMTDDAAFLLEVLGKGIFSAGYSADPTANPFTLDTTPLSSTTVSLAANEYIHGTDNELIYRYQLTAGFNTLDNFLCTSSLNDTDGSIITVRLYEADDSDSIPNFYCKVKQSSEADKNAEPLISDVHQLFFKYGIQTQTFDTSIPPNHTPTLDRFYYTTAANVTNWTQVFAVKIFLVLRSSEDKLTRTPMTYSVDGTSYTATDNRIYKVYSKTIFLRGLIQ